MEYTCTFVLPGFKKIFKYCVVFTVFFLGYHSATAQTCTGPIVADAPAAPVIDGIVDAAWAKAPVIPITKTVKGTLQGDYAAQWRAMYDNNYLYVLIEVKDNQIQHDGPVSGDDDAIEIYIDGANNKGSTYDAN